ncbi:MAG: iron ABC transporter substrate-binding protein [Actinomycetota bacterium]
MRRKLTVAALAALLALGAACANEPTEQAQEDAEETLTVYSGREEELVGPLIEQFEEANRVDVEVRYGDTADLASQIIEEGERSPADVFWAQDAGALGAVAAEDLFSTLPQDLTNIVAEGFSSPERHWVGTSGRARVLVYNKENVSEGELPASVLDLTDDGWKGRVGWAPTNGSFQAFVTALRKLRGEDTAREWLEGMKANDAQVFEGNSPIVQAVASGEIDAGLVNHYYLLELEEEDPDISEKAGNHFFEDGDPGNLINAAGVGILESTDEPSAAARFVGFLLSRTGEQYFGEETIEYPLQEGADPDERLKPLDEIGAPEIDLSDLSDLQATLDLLREAEVI